MIVCHDIKLLFTHVPKTGGSAVTAALLPYIGIPLTKEIGQKGWQPPLHTVGNMHAVWENIAEQARPYLNSGYRYAAAHRSPWERFSSLYHKRSFIGKGDLEKMGIEEFVEDKTGRFGWHVISCCQVAGPEVTHWIDYEHLDRDTRAVLTHCGVECPPPLVFTNVTENKRPAWEVLTPKAIEIIRERFADDIEKFGYEPPRKP